MISLGTLHDFFKKIGFNWTGFIEDPTNYFLPFESDELDYAPKNFEEILDYQTKSNPVPIFVMYGKNGTKFERGFKVLPQWFEEYLYVDTGTDYELARGKNFTKQWIEFQKEFNINC